MSAKDAPAADAEFANAFSAPHIATTLRKAAPSYFEAARDYWRVPFEGSHLSPRMKELVLLALHASATALNTVAMERHILRAQAAGASTDDILDTLVSIVGLANHGLWAALPVLVDELQKAGGPDAELPELTEQLQGVKRDFLETRGVWHETRDLLARLMPAYSVALSELSMAPWTAGSLTAKERELVYVAIDASVTHGYMPGLRMHIANALKLGATRAEILEVFELTSLLGLEGLVLGTDILVQQGAFTPLR